MIEAVHQSVHTAVVVEQSAVLLAAEHFALTATGLQVIGEPTFDDCCHYASGLGKIIGISALAVGDLLNYCEIKYGETYVQVAEALNLPEQKIPQLMNWKWVSSRITSTEREYFSAINENHKPPSYTMCYHLARIDDEEKRIELLETAAGKNWDSTDVKAAVDKLNRVPAPALADYVARAIAPLQRAAEAYPGSRRKLNDIIKSLEALL